MTPLPSALAPLDPPLDRLDTQVTTFLRDGRVRAALKRLKHLGHGACGDDVVRVCEAIAETDTKTFEDCQRILGEVVKTAVANERLTNDDKQTIVDAFKTYRKAFNHPHAFVDVNPRTFEAHPSQA